MGKSTNKPQMSDESSLEIGGQNKHQNPPITSKYLKGNRCYELKGKSSFDQPHELPDNYPNIF